MTESTDLTAEEEQRLLELAARKLRRAVRKKLGTLSDEERRALDARRSLADEEGLGQAAHIAVDNFNDAPTTAAEIAKWTDAGLEPPQPMMSYLRLGAVPPALRVQLGLYVDAVNATGMADPSLFPLWTGEDLALRVLDFTDDAMRRCSEKMADDDKDEETGATPDYAQNYNVPTERKIYSAELHTIGGWREHTDGNRITTTRGDKVEVVGGNYKLVVLCRDPLGNTEAGHDASGGHVSGATGARGARSRRRESMGVDPQAEHPGAEVDVAWERRHNGVWRSTETATKGDSKLTQFGDSDESSTGHYLESDTGKADPHLWHEPEACTEDPNECRTNPKIVSKTWAEEFESYTGSEKCPIPLLTTKTHVTKMVTDLYAHDMEDETVVETMTSSSQATTITDSTVAQTMKSKTTVEGTMTDTTVCQSMTTETLGNTLDLSFSTTVALTAGTSENLTVGGSGSVLVGAKTDTTLGARASVSVGPTLDIFIGAKASSTVGVEVDIAAIATREVGAAVEADNSLVHAFKGMLVKIG